MVFIYLAKCKTHLELLPAYYFDGYGFIFFEMNPD
jgi:hypothetical protein